MENQNHNELKQLWNKALDLESGRIPQVIRQQIKHKPLINEAIRKIKKSIYAEFILGFLVILYFMLYMFDADTGPVLRFVLGSFVVFLLGLLLSYFFWFVRIRETLTVSLPLKEGLEKLLETIDKYLHFYLSFNKWAGLFVVPFAFFYAVGIRSLKRMQHASELFDMLARLPWWLWLVFAVLLSLMMWLYIRLVHYYTRRYYQKHADELRNQLEQLGEEKS